MGRLKQLGIMILTTSFILSGCQKAPELSEQSAKKPVNVVKTEVVKTDQQLSFIGLTKAEKLKKLAFETGGKIGSISVKKGENVNKGQQLAKLEGQKYQIGVDASKAQVSAALSQYNKANEAVLFLEKQLSDAEKLLASGSITQATVDELSLKLKTTISDRESAKAQLDSANAGLRNSEATISDTALVSDFKGKVVDVLNEPGEMVAAGYPVIVVQNDALVVTFGVTQKDYSAIKIGMPLTFSCDGKTYTGKVTSVAEVPDQTTMTYEVQGSLSDNALMIGAIGNVYITNGTVSGTKVPMNVILSGEYDFVYIVKDGQAKKQKVKILSVNDNYAIVDGIPNGSDLIINGIKTLEDADYIQVTQ